jgi:hypothetical protein
LAARYEHDDGLHLEFMLLGCAVVGQRRLMAPELQGLSPDRDRSARQRAAAPLLARIGLVGQHPATVLPVIAEIKREGELLARRDRAGDLDLLVVLDDLVVERLRIDDPIRRPSGSSNS